MITKTIKISLFLLCGLVITTKAYSQKHFFELNGLNDSYTENFAITDNTLQNLNWSMVDDKEQKTEFKEKGLVFKSKKRNSTPVLDAEFKLDIELPTLLTYSFRIDELNDNSRAGIVYNYEDSKNFEGFIFDKKNWMAVKCQNGVLSKIKSGNNVHKSKYYNIGVCFEQGKVYFLLIHSNTGEKDKELLAKKVTDLMDNPDTHEVIESSTPIDDNHYIEELYYMKGDLKTSSAGFVISGKNKILVRGIGFTQANLDKED